MENENKKPSNPDFQKGANPMLQDRVTLRDYFAAKAMQSIISLLCPNDMNDSNFNWISDISYKQADTMLKQREL